MEKALHLLYFSMSDRMMERKEKALGLPMWFVYNLAQGIIINLGIYWKMQAIANWKNMSEGKIGRYE